MHGWVNGNDYERSGESFGILPLSEATRVKLGMLAYHPNFARDKKIRHRYLAQQQKTRMAILPVHTTEERALFRLLVQRSDGLFSGPNQPNWVAVAVEWNKASNGVHIFYKVCI
jgi:hypothetical protein